MTTDEAPGPDGGGAEVLDRAECLRLLGTALVGRVGATSGALPTVVPVRFDLVGEEIVLHPGSGPRLGVDLHGAVVAFEADAFDPRPGAWWSVVATGVARRREAGPGGAGGADPVIAVSTELLTGRRMARRPVPRAGTRGDRR